MSTQDPKGDAAPRALQSIAGHVGLVIDASPADVVAGVKKLAAQRAQEPAAALRCPNAITEMCAYPVCNCHAPPQPAAAPRQPLTYRAMLAAAPQTAAAISAADVLAEREACAALVDKLARRLNGSAKQVARETATLIRARGQEGGVA